MDMQKVDSFILVNGKYFNQCQIAAIRSLLLEAAETKWIGLQGLQFKDPTLCLILSLLVGGLGIDRFFVGDVGLGLLKLFTCGGFGIWTIIDWFLIMGTARDRNFQKLRLLF